MNYGRICVAKTWVKENDSSIITSRRSETGFESHEFSAKAGFQLSSKTSQNVSNLLIQSITFHTFLVDIHESCHSMSLRVHS